MKAFLDKYASSIIGVLSGFDRVIFRGHLRQLSYEAGLGMFLNAKGVLLKDFGKYAKSVSDELKAKSLIKAEREDRPIIYLSSSKASKEDLAKNIAKKDGIENGLITVFKAIEPCRSFEIYRNRDKKKLELVARNRKCLFLYHYLMHPIFGFMHVRIQTWLPFNVQVYINGREWLSREMTKAGMSFDKRDNSFRFIDNISRAQRMMDRQVSLDWQKELGKLARLANPAHVRIFGNFEAPYFFSAFQTEWATDVMFRSKKTLDRVYPELLRHGMMSFQSPDVMRFLGKKLNQDGSVHGGFSQDVTSDIKVRAEGSRIKFRSGQNSIKSYNKQGSVLRVETTINAPEEFKVKRPKEGQDQRERHLLPLRRGISDIERRTKVSQECNERYLEAQAEHDIKESLDQLTRKLTKPTTDTNGRRVRALNLFAKDDFDLLSAINRGEFLLTGFRNKDIRQILFPKEASPADQKKQSAKITRLFRILKAHGLIRKIPRTHRYQLTSKGRKAIAGITAAKSADIQLLNQLAA